jgi:hypothetical protein
LSPPDQAACDFEVHTQDYDWVRARDDQNHPNVFEKRHRAGSSPNGMFLNSCDRRKDGTTMKREIRNLRLHRWVLDCLLVTLLVAPAWPQSSTTTVSATVRDRTQAVIAKAAVALTNTATGVISRTTTNEAGFYIFAA